MKWSRKLTSILIVLVVIGVILAASFLFLIKDTVAPESSFEKLKSLPYIDWHPVKEEELRKTGVTLYDKDLAYKGLNIYNYNPHPVAYLIDMSGKVIHTWNYGKRGWHHVEMDENGNLLGVIQNSALVKLDWESRVIWISKMRYHHDIAIAANGDIYGITRSTEYIDYKSHKIPILNDFIVILSSDGEIKRKISIFGLFSKEIGLDSRKKIFEHVKDLESQGKDIKVKMGTIFNVFHTNTIEIIEKDIKHLAKKGNVLICLRNLNKIAIIDLKKEEIVWSSKEVDLDMPHQPTLNEEKILIFDNGRQRKYSRVIEIDPATEQIFWEYTGNPKRSFFSDTRGGVQRLPNGNTLITESNKARVFEVTERGKIVWEFFGTKVNKKSKKRIGIYRMTRIEPDSIEDMR